MGQVLIAGTLDFAGGDVAVILDGARPHIDAALAEAGCIHYAWTADVLTPGRMRVFEEWASVETLAAHLAGAPYRAMLGYLGGAGLTASDVSKYRSDLKQPVYDPGGVPRGDFYTA